MIKQLYLYSTSHCHLCELAYSLTMKIPDISVNVIDVAEDEFLLVEYGIRIPVLKRQDTKMELNWPFSEAEIHEFVE
jgi:hypothetical protein